MVVQVIPSGNNIFDDVLCLWFESYFILLHYLPIKKKNQQKKKKFMIIVGLAPYYEEN